MARILATAFTASSSKSGSVRSENRLIWKVSLWDRTFSKMRGGVISSILYLSGFGNQKPMIITRWFLNTQKNIWDGKRRMQHIYESETWMLHFQKNLALIMKHCSQSGWWFRTKKKWLRNWSRRSFTFWMNTVVRGMFRSPFSTHFQWDKLPFSCFFTRGSLSNLAIAQWYHLSHVSAKKKGPETQFFTKIFQKRTADNFQAMFRQHLKASISGL